VASCKYGAATDPWRTALIALGNQRKRGELTLTAKRNLDLIEAHIEAIGSGDSEVFAFHYAEDAVLRMAGVPDSLGGVLKGRWQIVDNFRNQPQRVLEIRQMFADDSHVCAVAKVTSVLAGTRFLRGNDQGYTSFECTTYRIADGRIQEETTYVNWLDVYVQTGLVELESLTDSL
jgi:ketosteroid isomerase-like protein